jgi:hypothetical protein
MHHYTVNLKNGEMICGIIWTQRSSEGWFTIIPDKTGESRKIWLRDVESGYCRTERVGIDQQTGKARLGEDLLEHARLFGWDGT